MVAITAVGVDEGVLGAGEAAALVGAAMVSVLVLPLLALRLRAPDGRGAARAQRSAGTESW